MRTTDIAGSPSILSLARRLRNPAATAAFGTGLLLNLASLPPRSSVTTELRDSFVRFRMVCRRGGDMYVVALESGGPRIVSPLTNESLGDALTLVEPGPGGRVIRAMHMTGVPPGALWARAWSHTAESIGFIDDTSAFTAEQLLAARRLIADDLAACGYIEPSLAPELGGADIQRSTVRWGGVFLNTAAAACAAGLINSLGWVPYHSAWRRDRRLRAGQCPCCRYSIVGNTSGVCPECGETLSLTPAAPPPR